LIVATSDLARSGRGRRVARRVRRLPLIGDLLARPSSGIAFGIVVLVILIAIFAPAISTANPNTLGIAHRYEAPSLHHLLGTDYLGRDLLSRVIYGTRMAMEVAVPAVLGAFVGGLFLGVLAGYAGRAVDAALTVPIDAMLAFPSVILGLALLSLLGPSPGNTALVIAVGLLPWYARLARTQTLAAKQNAYVKAERSLGASTPRILTVHVVPNIIPPLLIVMAMDIPSAISIEAGLAFLGLGAQPPTPDWGVMLQDGFSNIQNASWPVVGPLVAIVVVTAAFTILGEALRDITDPTMVVGRRRLNRVAALRKV
jgi:peptide/nickel transport system permease protein